WNLYCALHRASLDVTGTFQHRSAAMQEVRWVVDERTHGKDLEHRLMDYNNLPETTLTEIKRVLTEARRRLEAMVGTQVADHEVRVGLPSSGASPSTLSARRHSNVLTVRSESGRRSLGRVLIS